MADSAENRLPAARADGPSQGQPQGPPLLERDAPLARLDEIARRVQQRRQGECVLVHGEAGIGKTSLVHSFVRSLEPATIELLIASNEALYTPRPLGPLVDLADRFPPSVSKALYQGNAWSGLFPALLAHLRDASRPIVFVIEDLHWADAATLDFVRYLARRLHDVALMLLLTYRSDELAADHPLRRAIGDLPATHTTRIALSPLSADAVATLARRAERPARRVYEATGGNPFFVTELLSTEGSGLPPSINDAVLARLAALSPPARELAEWISVFPNQVDAGLLKVVAPDAQDSVDEALQRGLLVTRGEALAFRHELAREAVHQSITPYRRARLHTAIFAALSDCDDDDASLPRRVHHAEGAGLVDDVLRLAPRAARHAAAAGAHREAARLYALALRHGTSLPPAELVDLLGARADACALTSQHGEAIRARREALALARQLGDRHREGVSLRWLARLHGWSDCLTTAFTHARAAIAVLETLPPGAELAIAYSTLSHLSLAAGHMDDVRTWGDKAITLAERLGDAEAASQAMNSVGIARLRSGDDAPGWATLESARDLAIEHHLDAEAALAFNNLHTMALVHRHFARAIEHAESGIAFCESKGIDVFTARMLIRRAFAYLQTGRWDLAATDLSEVREHHALMPMERATADFIQGLLDLRRGATGAPERLAQVISEMQRLGVRIWFTSAAAACAEIAWLRGDADAVREVVEPALAQAIACGDRWCAGELAAWLMRATGTKRSPRVVLAGPYDLESTGLTRDAAETWARLGCPYEQALALAGGGEAEVREALERFERLGATPAVTATRRRLRALGARGVSRGPQPRTRDNPHGLTAREREVFELLLLGLSNAAIAARLHRSERTVEHHVAAAFGKLGVNSRAGLIATFGPVRPRTVSSGRSQRSDMGTAAA